jgi:hypothetical protein
MKSTFKTILISAFTSIVICTLFVSVQGLAVDSNVNFDKAIGGNSNKIVATNDVYAPCGIKNGKCYCGYQYAIVTIKGKKRCIRKTIPSTKVATKLNSNKDCSKIVSFFSKDCNKSNVKSTNVAGKFFAPDPKTPVPKKAAGGSSRMIEQPKDIEPKTIG